MLEYLCLVTTPSYAAGAVCLAQSLELCGSQAVLRAIATSEEAQAALQFELSQCASSSSSLPLLRIELMPVELPSSPTDITHGAKGASLSVDAPRRVLFDREKPFILLDADLVAVQNPDPFFLSASSVGSDKDKIQATANFRVKKRCFGPSSTGNFNAGVMVVQRPQREDGAKLGEMVSNAGVDDTEELLLNELFRGRWTELPHGLNVPKRVMHHAPLVWNALIDSRELVFVHYMGAKPWICDPKRRLGADWEADRPEYLLLEQLWWKVRRGDAVTTTDLLAEVPRATTTTTTTTG